MKTRSIRIPDYLDEALIAAARAEHISVQARIVQSLERDLAAHGLRPGAGHSVRIAAALEAIHSRREPGYREAMQALENAHRAAAHRHDDGEQAGR